RAKMRERIPATGGWGEEAPAASRDRSRNSVNPRKMSEKAQKNIAHGTNSPSALRHQGSRGSAAIFAPGSRDREASGSDPLMIVDMGVTRNRRWSPVTVIATPVTFRPISSIASSNVSLRDGAGSGQVEQQSSWRISFE